jgi:aminoglycoside phosphotransferase (APT) family kinase protein
MKPPADIHVDASTVRALLREQHPDFAELPLVPAGEGWDTALFRLGDGWVVRIPRRALTGESIAPEPRWLLELAPALPLPIPVAVRRPTHRPIPGAVCRSPPAATPWSGTSRARPVSPTRARCGRSTTPARRPRPGAVRRSGSMATCTRAP